jgi:hypothetical protein
LINVWLRQLLLCHKYFIGNIKKIFLLSCGGSSTVEQSAIILSLGAQILAPLAPEG